MDTSTDFPLYKIEEEEDDEEPILSQCIDTEIQCREEEIDQDEEPNLSHCADKEVPCEVVDETKDETESEQVDEIRTEAEQPKLESIVDCGSKNDGDGDSTRNETPEMSIYDYEEPIEKLNFVLHPRLQLHHDSNTSCLSSPGPETLTFGRSKDPVPGILTTKPNQINRGLGLERRKNVRFKTSGAGSPNRDSDFEIHVESKTVDEILYDIATGKWPSKSLIYDDEEKSTRKICERPCSNANCVREAERLRKKQQDILLQTENDLYDFNNYYNDGHDDMTIGQGERSVNDVTMGQGQRNNDVVKDDIVFEDGDLPSYHSLISMWNVQNKYGWEENVFRNGYPTNDIEFLEAWRACRRNPEAYGIKVKPRQEVPTREELRKAAKSKTASLKAAIKMEILKSKTGNKISLPNKVYSKGLGAVKETIPPKDREKLKARYNELREMYPHLPVLKPMDFKLKPSTIRIRLKQAEDWHRLVTAANKPQPVKRWPNRDASYRDNNDNKEEVGSPPELSDINIPRYAAATESFMHKMRSTMRSNIIDEPY